MQKSIKKMMPSKRPSNFHRFLHRFFIDFGSVFASNLGAKTAQNSKKWRQNIGTHPPKSGSGYEPAFQDRSRAFWPQFLEGQGSIFDDFWMIFRTSWLTLGMLSDALAGGATPFQTHPLLTWLSLFLLRPSATFAKEIQELAEDKAENP